MRVMAAMAVAGLLVGCAVTPPPSDNDMASGPKRCDAQAARSLIGSHAGAVDFAPGANVRIVCTTCATTRDYRPDRLNVRFVEATGIIASVDCG